jgi:hypothetical protein
MTNTSFKSRILGTAWPRHFNRPIAEEMYRNIEGTYGLRQHVSGSVNYYTHYAYTSAGSVADAMESSLNVLRKRLSKLLC